MSHDSTRSRNSNSNSKRTFNSNSSNNTNNNNNNNGRSFNKKKKKLDTNQQTLGAAWGSNSLSSSRSSFRSSPFSDFGRITSKCLPAILKLQHLEELVLEGCFGIDDDSLATLKQESKSLKILDMSSIQNVSHVGLSSLTNGIGCLQQLTLAYGSLVTLDLARSLQRLSKLQSIKLDGCAVTCSGLQAIGNGCCDTFSNRDLFPSPYLGFFKCFPEINRRCISILGTGYIPWQGD